MNVQKEPLQNGHIKLTVEASADEVDKAFVLGMDMFIDQLGIPVEQGKTSYEQLEAVLGARVEEAVSDAVMNFLLPFALEESKETPIVSPRAVPEGQPEKGKPFNFTVEILPKPSFELSSYDPVTVVVDDNPVTEEDIEQQMLMIAQNASTTQPDIITGEMKQVTPKITDDWVAKNIPDDSIQSVDDLRKRLREAGEQYKADELEQQKMNIAVGEMTQRFESDIPTDIIESMTADMMAGVRAQVNAQGMPFDEYLKQVKMTEDQLEYSMQMQAGQMLKEGFALDAVFRHAGLTIEEDDIKEAITSMAPGNEAETEAMLKETGRMFALTEAAQRIKAGKWILENANVTVRK